MAIEDGTVKHLVFGGQFPFEQDIQHQHFYDEPLYCNQNPEQYGAGSGIFESKSAEAIQAANYQQAAGLASAAGASGDPIDMQSASDNSDPGKGGISYGPRNTGR